VSDIKRFPYKGRIIVSGPDITGKNTIVGYQADATEIAKQKKAWGADSVNEQLGVVNMLGYIDNKKEKRYDFASAYDLNPYQGITNAELLSSMVNDSNFYRTATGNTTGNTSPSNPSQPGSPGSSQPVVPPNTSPVVAPTGLIYPEDLASSDQDRIRFWAAEYITGKSRGLSGSGNPSLASVVGNKVEVPVFLPIQSAISDQNAVGWEPDTLNPIELYAVNASLGVMEAGSMENVTKVAADNFNTALQRLRSSESEVRTYLAGQAVGVNNLLSRLQGQVLNPNLELLFQGPQLRPFSFTFKLSARNDDEAKTIKQIINYFKKYMAPRYNDGDLFIRAPHIFEIKYLYKNKEDHPGLNQIKACALTNFSVDYTPLGSYMTYEDGTMVAYTLSMQFQELTPIYENDYAGHDIGY
jgi:hypothetical protein